MVKFIIGEFCKEQSQADIFRVWNVSNYYMRIKSALKYRGRLLNDFFRKVYSHIIAREQSLLGFCLAKWGTDLRVYKTVCIKAMNFHSKHLQMSLTFAMCLIETESHGVKDLLSTANFHAKSDARK